MNAQTAFLKRRRNVQILLDRIGQEMDVYAGIPVSNITWANVGDMGRLELDLREILDYSIASNLKA